MATTERFEIDVLHCAGRRQKGLGNVIAIDNSPLIQVNFPIEPFTGKVECAPVVLHPRVVALLELVEVADAVHGLADEVVALRGNTVRNEERQGAMVQ